MEIKKYIGIQNRIGFFYKYLHIIGGSGRTEKKNRNGGEFDFIVFYATPTEMKGKGEICERIWCENNDIIYGEGSSIGEAYQDYLKKAQ